MNFNEIGKEVFIELAQKAYDLKMIIKEHEKEYSFLMASLKTLTKETSCIAGDYFFEVGLRKGSVDYTQIQELKGVNLELYRKPDVITTSIKKVTV